MQKLIKRTENGITDLPDAPNLFEVRILQTTKGKLKIISKLVDGNEVYDITIPSKKRELLIKQFQSDFKFLISHLRVLDNRMVLLNPKT